MKKLLLAAMGLTGLLASCGGTVVVTYPAVTITQLNSYTSDFYTERVENGQTVRDYVICNDRATNVYMDTSWSGPLARLAANLTYTSNSGATRQNEISTVQFAADTSGRDVFQYTIGANALTSNATALSVKKSSGLSAQSLKPQAIVVSPVAIGTVAVDLWGYNPAGVKSNVLEAPQTIPVLSSCN